MDRLFEPSDPPTTLRLVGTKKDGITADSWLVTHYVLSKYLLTIHFLPNQRSVMNYAWFQLELDSQPYILFSKAQISTCKPLPQDHGAYLNSLTVRESFSPNYL